MLAAAASAVAPGGRLLVLGLGLSDHMGTGGPGPERRYTPERISGAFPGIELARCERVTRQVETDDGPREAVDVLAWGWRPHGAGPSAKHEPIDRGSGSIGGP